MSYLDPTRLHFAGQFQANVSTVNNDAYHFNNAAFEASWQDMQGAGMKPPNGWFNPQGDGAWRLLGCAITGAYLPSGVVRDDPVLSCQVSDSDETAPGKLADLDPEQQLVSQIWGLTVRIADSGGNTLMEGQFEASAFFDIWDRGLKGGGGDTNAGAYWQSVLTGVTWSDVSASPFLTALKTKAQAAGDKLSIKFNTDGINMSYDSPDFMCGRLVGTIGPYCEGEPDHLVLGRHLMAAAAPGGNFFLPKGKLNFLCGRIDNEAGGLFLDLGNALPTTIAGGPIADLGDLSVGIYDPSDGSVSPLTSLPSMVYAASDWYACTAGVAFLALDDDQIAAASSLPLAIVNTTNDVSIYEAPSGAFLRADSFVRRLSPGDQASVDIYATILGEPAGYVDVAFALDKSQLQPTPDQWPFAGASPPVAVPESAIPIPASTTTDGNGKATLSFIAGDPGNVRWFNNGLDYGLDGQVYGVRPSFADSTLQTGPVNQWDFVSFLIWSGWSPAHSPPQWSDIQPIMQQYANLYPVMNRFLDLGSQASVDKYAYLLKLAFGLPMTDPNHMPVTRDLSPAKREAILSYLEAQLAGQAAGEAVPHPPPPAKDRPLEKAIPEAEPAEAASAPELADAYKGGKAAAAARRLIVQEQAQTGDFQ